MLSSSQVMPQAQDSFTGLTTGGLTPGYKPPTPREPGSAGPGITPGYKPPTEGQQPRVVGGGTPPPGGGGITPGYKPPNPNQNPKVAPGTPEPPPAPRTPGQRGIPEGGRYTPGEYGTGYRPPSARSWGEQPVQTDGGATTGGRAPGLYTAGGAAQVTVDRPDTAAFMNPYIQQAMEPALRDIEKRFGKQRSQIGATAATSGAFGDDRHRMLDEAAYRDERQTLADTMMSAMKSGYDTSLGAAERDADRLLGASQFNAGMQDKSIDRQVGVQENAANRDMNWNQFIQQLDQTEQDRSLRAAELGNALDMSQNSQMMQYGQEAAQLDNYIRGWEQQGLNANYEDYMQKIMWPMTILSGSKGAMSAPQGQNQNNSFMNLLGSMFGGMFS